MKIQNFSLKSSPIHLFDSQKHHKIEYKITFCNFTITIRLFDTGSK